MGKTSLPCISGLNNEACLFISAILEGVTELGQSLTQGPVSLRWAAEAMNFLKNMQVQLLPLLNKSNLPISYGAEEDWFDQYMKDTAALLSLCNAFKPVISRITRYRMAVELTIHELLHDANPSSSLNAKTKELEFLERENEGFLDATKTVSVEDAIKHNTKTVSVEDAIKHNSSLSLVILAAKTTIGTISLLLISAFLSYPVSIHLESADLSSILPQLKQIVSTLKDLIEQFEKQQSSSSESGSSLLSLFEIESVNKAVKDLKAQVVEGAVRDQECFFNFVEQLRTRCVELKERIDMFDAAIDEVFDAVIKRRNDTLDIRKNGTFTS